MKKKSIDVFDTEYIIQGHKKKNLIKERKM